jgi:hypothetical protein
MEAIQGFSYLSQQTVVALGSGETYRRVSWQEYDEAVKQGARRLTASTTTVSLASDDEDFDRRYDAGLPVEERRLVLVDRTASEAQPGYPNNGPPVEHRSWKLEDAPESLLFALDWPS